MGRELTGK